MIVNLGSKKCENNYTSTFQLTCLQYSLLLSIVASLENYLSYVDKISDVRKLLTSSVKSS